MPIHPPGQRYRYNKHMMKGQGTKRDVAAVLQLTAMVDMFTVLAIFLLQNPSKSPPLNFLSPKDDFYPLPSPNNPLLSDFSL